MIPNVQVQIPSLRRGNHILDMGVRKPHDAENASSQIIAREWSNTHKGRCLS
jgi:hypothetical protein